MLPNRLENAELGTFNLHASWHAEYRGAAQLIET
jgi:methionyl-tRNA formyltransferase